MTPLTREYLEARGFHESSAIETGYRSQFTQQPKIIPTT